MMVAVARLHVSIGTRSHRLVVIDNEVRMPRTAANIRDGKPGRRALRVRCDCGNEKVIMVTNFLNGHIKSCGCYRVDRMAVGDVQPSTHHYSHHEHFDRWTSAVQRCEFPHHKSYDRYGGRGIKIHPAWRHDAKAFCDWLDQNLGPRPVGYSLDRIDNDGHYEPGNLRWASASEQALNRGKRNVVGIP